MKINYMMLKKLIDKNYDKNLVNLSSWDAEHENIIKPIQLIKNIENHLIKEIDNYFFIEDTYNYLPIKNYISNKTQKNATYNFEFLVGPNSTSLLSLSVIALHNLNVNNFLLINPTYFSVIESLGLFDVNIINFHTNFPNFKIDFNKLEKIVFEKSINCIIITDPFYGSGKNFSLNDYEKLIDICNKYNCYLLVDYARGGLSWYNNDNKIINIKLLNTFSRLNNYILIDSISKKILSNGIKVALIFSNSKILNEICKYGDSLIGSICAAQKDILHNIYSNDFNEYLNIIIENNIKIAKNNYNLICSFLIKTNFIYTSPDDGYFFLIGIPRIIKEKNLNDYEMFSLLLTNLHIITLPSSLYNLFDSNYYIFRINLLFDVKIIIESLNKISLFYKEFNN